VVGIMGFLSASSLSSGSARSWSSGLGIGVSVGRSVGSSVVIRFQGFGFVANLWGGGKFGKRVKAIFGIFGGTGNLKSDSQFQIDRIWLRIFYSNKIKQNWLSGMQAHQECAICLDEGKHTEFGVLCCGHSFGYKLPF
jgi:hypothetical protein